MPTASLIQPLGVRDAVEESLGVVGMAVEPPLRLVQDISGFAADGLDHLPTAPAAPPAASSVPGNEVRVTRSAITPR